MLWIRIFLALSLAVAVTMPTSTDRKGAGMRTAQAIGTRCQTRVGICPWPPRPVGSACACGQYPGFVIQ